GGVAKYYGLQATDSGLMLLDTTGSTNRSGGRLDTVMSVYAITSLAQLDLLESNPCSFVLGSDDNGGADGLSSRLSFAVQAGYYYIVEVDVANGEKGNITLNWQLTTAPVPFEYSATGLQLLTATNLLPVSCMTYCDPN